MLKTPTVSKEDIVKELLVCSGALGKVPTRDEFAKMNTLVGCYKSSIRYYFKTHNDLLVAASLPITKATRRPPVNISCGECSKGVDVPAGAIKEVNFCSSSCSATFHNKRRKVAREEKGIPLQVDRTLKVCHNCGTDHNSTMNVCSYRCRTEVYAKTHTIGEACTEGERQQKYSNIRGISRGYAKYFLPCFCQNCGFSKHTEIAHIKALTEFKASDLLIEAIDKNNLLSLCPNCHWEFDYGDLTFSEITQSERYISNL
jgi:hypothetical protein